MDQRFLHTSLAQAGKRVVLVLVTAPELKTARKLAQAALEAKVAACANLVPKIESQYWWEGKIVTDSEVLIIFKTTAAKLDVFEKLILASHPYDTPEFIFVQLTSGTKRYLDWVRKAVGQKTKGTSERRKGK